MRIVSVYSVAVQLNRDKLDKLYGTWNRPEFISPDPLETLEPCTRTADREVAALLASSLAYGRVATLLVPLRAALARMGASPCAYVVERSEERMASDMAGLVYRFARPEHLAALLAGAGAVIAEYGSLEKAFLQGYAAEHESPGGRQRLLDGLQSFTTALRHGSAGSPGHLLCRPEKGSGCKRLLLFLRWMVRRDSVDPGGWTSVSPAHLLPPLDTWTHRIALHAGWTKRKSPDMKAVLDTAEALKALNTQDPVRYDFALSRFGIRSHLNLDMLFAD